MNWWYDLLENPLLIAGISSWFVAQLLKTVIHSVINRRLEISRLWGDGGMPSGHSATVTAVAIMSALRYGTGSAEFAISGIMAIIVCHDAMGVRLETGKQAVVINELVKAYSGLASREIRNETLKEFVGHTPVQVVAGIAVGIANAFVMYYIIF